MQKNDSGKLKNDSRLSSRTLTVYCRREKLWFQTENAALPMKRGHRTESGEDAQSSFIIKLARHQERKAVTGGRESIAALLIGPPMPPFLCSSARSRSDQCTCTFAATWQLPSPLRPPFRRITHCSSQRNVPPQRQPPSTCGDQCLGRERERGDALVKGSLPLPPFFTLKAPSSSHESAH